MRITTFLEHRLRDFDAVFRADKKGRLFLFVLFRQFAKLLGINEARLQNLIPDNTVHLNGHRFSTRAKALDFLFFSKYYEAETSNYILRQKGKIFIDIGAHIGRFASLASPNFQQVYAFEPQPSNYQTLCKNLKQNNFNNVEAINAALSNKEQDVFLSGLNVNTGWVYITDEGSGPKAKAFSLDSWVKAKAINVSDVGLILIDAEGHELEVLEGSQRLLREANPVLIMESFDNEKIVTFLAGFGYKKTQMLDSLNYVFEKPKN